MKSETTCILLGASNLFIFNTAEKYSPEGKQEAIFTINK